MSETFLELMTRSRAEVVRHALDHWRSAALPLNADDRQDATRVCLELAHDLRNLIGRAIRQNVRSSPPEVRTLQERRQVLEVLCDQVHANLLALRILLLSPNHLNGPSAETARLDRALEEVREAKEYLIRDWPVCSREELAEIHRQIERGEGVDAEDAFARIAGVDVETWRRRVEEYKRRQS